MPPAVEASLPVIAGYERLVALGRTGVAALYRARPNGRERTVVLKVVDRRTAPPEFAVRLRLEAAVLRQVDSPHIVRLLDAGDAPRWSYLVLEDVGDRTLSDRLAADGPLPPTEAARIVAAIAAGLAQAHRAGFLHRDIKPSNVLLAADGTPKLAHFDLAKPFADAHRDPDTPGGICGTFRVMAPEQTRGSDRLTPATDVWGLGVLLYELLTGRSPFADADRAAAFALVRDSDPPSLRRLRPDCPPSLERLCLHCLAKEPEQRFADVAALAEALERYRQEEVEPVPFAQFVAFREGRLVGADADAVRRRAAEPRWRAHLESLEALDLERVAARHDAVALGRFESDKATLFCREVARTDGSVLFDLVARRRPEALGAGRAEWDAHIGGCVYCRRMRRLAQARLTREAHGVPADEPLAREWLLEPLYREALDRVTRILAPERQPSAHDTGLPAGAETVAGTKPV